jgi:general secretion pathway protein I
MAIRLPGELRAAGAVRHAVKRQQPLAGRRHARGFSLIEMVAAFLVFAIGMGVLMQILATSMHSARRSSDYTMAALWAQSRLDVVGVGEPIEEGQSSGRFDDTYAWTLDIHEVDPLAIEALAQSARAQQPQAVAQGGRTAQPANQVAAANAGLGGGIEVAPFKLYQVDLLVSWGNGPGGQQHTAHFGTLRATNPEPNRPVGGAFAQPGRSNPSSPMRNRPMGGGRR